MAACRRWTKVPYPAVAGFFILPNVYATRKLLLACVLVLGCTRVAAEPQNPLEDRFSVSVGTFLFETDTQLHVDGSTRRGTDLDAERDLGIGNTDSVRLDAYWRFAPRHKVRVVYFSTQRSALKVIDQQIDYGDVTFPANAEVSSRFKTEVAELAYEYAFMRRDTFELAGSAGVHNLRFGLDLSSERQGVTAALQRDANANGPLPVIGLRAVWRFGDRLHLDAQAQFFRISFNQYDGHLSDYNVTLVWMPLDHFGLGAGYNEFITHVDVSADQFNGGLRWRYSGARIFVNASF